MDIPDDWKTELEVELLDLLCRYADKLKEHGPKRDAAGISVAAAARVVVNRFDPAY
jgi:hypothetical protein